MAWSWSHTQKAYDDAYRNLKDLPTDTLAVIFAEWRASEGDGFTTNLNLHRYSRELRRAYSWLHRGLLTGIIAEIWDKAFEQQTCSNGGWEAWLCPFGCGCHTVPFDRE